MNDFEQLATALARKGYYAALHRQAKNWQCTLFNSVLEGSPPSGTGATCLDALHEANAERVRREK